LVELSDIVVRFAAHVPVHRPPKSVPSVPRVWMMTWIEAGVPLA
jgi:hypothetical protein